MRHLPSLCDPPLVETQAIAGAGAERDQQVHVAGPGPHGLPTRHVETRTKNELHRRGEHELHPGRQHPMQATEVAKHWNDQRCGEQQRGNNGPAFTAQTAFALVSGRLAIAAGLCLVAGGLDRCDQY